MQEQWGGDLEVVIRVLQTALARADRSSTRPGTLVRPDLDPVEVGMGERPPLVGVSGYRRQTA